MSALRTASQGPAPALMIVYEYASGPSLREARRTYRSLAFATRQAIHRQHDARAAYLPSALTTLAGLRLPASGSGATRAS